VYWDAFLFPELVTAVVNVRSEHCSKRSEPSEVKTESFTVRSGDSRDLGIDMQGLWEPGFASEFWPSSEDECEVLCEDEGVDDGSAQDATKEKETSRYLQCWHTNQCMRTEGQY
jgi:hypothetical protein